MVVPRPPEVTGFPAARERDVLRLTWWAEWGFLHGATRGSVGARAFSVFLAAAWWPSLPVLLVGQLWALRRGTARYYFSPSRDAVLALVARPDGWHVAEHSAAAPGAGRGRALREALMPPLLAAADAQGVAVHATAANRTLARQYSTELPGLVDVGRGLFRGRRLQRPLVRGRPSRLMNVIAKADHQAGGQSFVHDRWGDAYLPGHLERRGAGWG